MDHGSIRRCSYCNKDKPWIWNGKKLKDGSKVYTDEHGSRWAGRRCPVCERTRVHAAVRCDGFGKNVIIRQLEQSGFEVVSKSLPLKVNKDGQTYTVGIKRAYTKDGKVVLEAPIDDGPDLVALVFESVRICTTDQLEKLSGNFDVYKSQSKIQKPKTMNPDR